MKENSSNQKTSQHNPQDAKQAPSAGPEGLAVTPPEYQLNSLPIQREATPPSSDDGQDNRAPNRTGLPDALKAGVEALSGLSMDDVRVHTNSSKPAQLQALAYTQGTDIHVAPGEERHIPHEAWHVVQQKRGVVRPSFKLKSGPAINDNAQLENEADQMGSKAQTMGSRPFSGSLVQSPIAANAPQQLKATDSSGDVVQRRVATWGGQFNESNYAPKSEKFMGSTLIGAYIKLTFTPNNNCPRDVKIGLIQVVRVIGEAENEGLQKKVLRSTERWAIDRQNDSNPVYGSIDTDGNKSRELTDNPPSIEQERESPTSRNMIEVGAQLGERRKNSVQPAILTDDPRISLNRAIQQQMLFETTAVVLEGPQKGLALGTVSWGWTKAAGSTQPVLHPVARIAQHGTSTNLEAAKDVWNAAAEEHELVPIPDIQSAPNGGGRGGCFITTACVEHMGLGDNCDELTTLRQFRDIYLMRKPNGQKLINLYYKYSPKIVTAIDQQEDKKKILDGLYQIICQCVDAIKAENHEWAYQTYCRMVMELKEQFISEVKMPKVSY